MTKADAVWLWDNTLMRNTTREVFQWFWDRGKIYTDVGNAEDNCNKDAAAFLREWADALESEDKG